jgi:predicted transcriptional regulator
MKKMSLREQRRKRGLARVLVAQGKLSDEEIAKELGITVFMLTDWKATPYFKSSVDMIRKFCTTR